MNDPLVEQVSSALDIARAAVDADAREDYAIAMKKYRDTIQLIERIKDKITPESARSFLLQKVYTPAFLTIYARLRDNAGSRIGTIRLGQTTCIFFYCLCE